MMQITSAAEVRAILGPPISHNQANKVIDHIDEHCRAWIARTPFIVISSISAGNAMDVSPKGDPPGFVKVLDKRTIAIPDRIGNGPRGHASQSGRKSECRHRVSSSRSGERLCA
jgi:predicted pyridoxine 5'-phosphate oxidase superfamily flavin-nucleotide-binding protein